MQRQRARGRPGLGTAAEKRFIQTQNNSASRGRVSLNQGGFQPPSAKIGDSLCPGWWPLLSLFAALKEHAGGMKDV